MEFSEKLKTLRAQQGLTQEQLAQRLYVTRTAVSRWETGTGTPNLDSLQALARLFGVSVDDLLSTDALITLAQDERRAAVRKSSLLAFGLLDILATLSLLLPLFGVHEKSFVRMASLLEFGQATDFGVAFLLVVAMCTSRCYLMVHYSTDVLAGCLVGAATAALAYLAVKQATNLLKHRQQSSRAPQHLHRR